MAADRKSSGSLHARAREWSDGINGDMDRSCRIVGSSRLVCVCAPGWKSVHHATDVRQKAQLFSLPLSCWTNWAFLQSPAREVTFQPVSLLKPFGMEMKSAAATACRSTTAVGRRSLGTLRGRGRIQRVARRLRLHIALSVRRHPYVRR